MSKRMKIIAIFFSLTIVLSSCFLIYNVLYKEKIVLVNLIEEDKELDKKGNNKENNDKSQKELTEEECILILQNLFDTRNNLILKKDPENIKSLYETDKNAGRWAYEHEINKMKYLENWSHKQGVKFNEINTKIRLRKINKKKENLYEVICSTSTTYKYSYENQSDISNSCKIGTNHYLNIKYIDGEYIIAKEWYEDPFADSLNLENIKSDDTRNFILSQEKKNFDLTKEQQIGIEYAHRYCGVSEEEEYDFKFNKEYKNFNPEGGDCANFASQIMFASGRFKKNSVWNYEDRSGTKAWVNAQGFTNYILNSGRGSLISKGSYKDIYKVAYNMRPGDFVAYEKGGRITHVSTVTGTDSKGYPLVTCHNTDRLLVPWDLGWSNQNIKFHLIRVHY